MSAHDDLCPVVTYRLRKSWCQCALIAKVRADERARASAEVAEVVRLALLEEKP